MHAPVLTLPDRAIDALVAAAFIAVSLLLIVGVVEPGGGRAVAMVLAVAHSAPLAERRRWPLIVVAVMAATAALTVPLGVPVVVLGPAASVGVYTVGACVEPRRSKWVLAALLAVTGLVVSANGADAGTVGTNTVALTVAWWLGDRSRRAALETEAERAAAAEAARRAAVDERMRIARELHDVVAHAMSVIAVQAGTGRFVIEESPQVAADALAAIEVTSRGALQEMRRLLAVLRDDGSGHELLPSPGLGDLDELAAASVESGTRVEVVTCGRPVPLPAGLDLCAYRIVQEALTNVRKHAPGSRANVVVSFGESSLTVAIADDGRGGSAPAGAGHGLVGMRERVALYDGTLVARPGDHGGFRVVATFPLEAPP